MHIIPLSGTFALFNIFAFPKQCIRFKKRRIAMRLYNYPDVKH